MQKRFEEKLVENFVISVQNIPSSQGPESTIYPIWTVLATFQKFRQKYWKKFFKYFLFLLHVMFHDTARLLLEGIGKF